MRRQPIKNSKKTSKENDLRKRQHYTQKKSTKNSENSGTKLRQSQKINNNPRSTSQEIFDIRSDMNENLHSMPNPSVRKIDNKPKYKVASPTAAVSTTPSSTQNFVPSTIPRRHMLKGFSSDGIRSKDFNPIEGNFFEFPIDPLMLNNDICG